MENVGKPRKLRETCPSTDYLWGIVFIKVSVTIVYGGVQLSEEEKVSHFQLFTAFLYLHLEPETTIYKWLFQLDDSKSLHRKWLFHQTSIKNWLFGVPGIYIYLPHLSPSHFSR